MDTKQLYQILAETTVSLRKGEVFEGSPDLVEQAKSGSGELKGGGVLEIYAMPHEAEAMPTLVKVDVEFMIVGVDRAAAERRRDDLVAILNDFPPEASLSQGPSYIQVGGVIGSQEAAFHLFALGQVLGLWSLITPATFGMTGEEARRAAGSGYIMITGYLPSKAA